MRNDQTLDGLFDAMRDEPAVAVGTIARLVEQTAKPSAAWYRPSRSIGIASIVAVVLLGASILIVNTTGGGKPQNGLSNQSPTSRTMLTSVDVDTSTTSATTEPVDGDTIRDDRGEGGSSATLEERVPRTQVDGQRSLRREPTDLARDDLRPSIDVEGSNIIRLGQHDLAAIGVHVSASGVVECYARSVAYTRSNKHPDTVVQEDARLSLMPSRGRTMLIAKDEIPEGVEPTVLPELITDEEGYAYLFDAHARRLEMPEHVQRIRDSLERRRLARPRMVNALLPVRVRGGSLAIDGGDDNDIILWYRPDPRLIVALPPCLRDQLLSELDSVVRGRADELEQGSKELRAAMSPELRARFDSILAAGRRIAEPCREPVAGRPLLDIWRSSAGAISAAQVTPNAIEQTGQLSVTLSADRVVQVWLHGIDGARLRSLAEAVPMRAGRGTILINAAGVAPGLYLVVVVTDYRERAVLRVIVQ